MKRLFAVLGLAALVAMPASAQLSWGVRGGLNLVNNDIKAVSTESVQNKDSYTGFFVGPMMEFQIPILGIGVDASILYSQKGLQMEEGEDMKNQSIAVPVSLKYTFGLGNFLGIFAQAGAQFDYKLGDLDKQFSAVKAGNTEKGEVKDFILEKNTWSVNVGAGVKLLGHIQAGVNYNIPVSKEGTYAFYDNVDKAANGSFDNLKEANKKGQEAFKASTLQFVLTYTF